MHVTDGHLLFRVTLTALLILTDNGQCYAFLTKGNYYSFNNTTRRLHLVENISAFLYNIIHYIPYKLYLNINILCLCRWQWL